jgi:hypothetical protein
MTIDRETLDSFLSCIAIGLIAGLGFFVVCSILIEFSRCFHGLGVSCTALPEKDRTTMTYLIEARHRLGARKRPHTKGNRLRGFLRQVLPDVRSVAMTIGFEKLAYDVTGPTEADIEELGEAIRSSFQAQTSWKNRQRTWPGMVSSVMPLFRMLAKLLCPSVEGFRRHASLQNSLTDEQLSGRLMQRLEHYRALRRT